MNAIKKQVEELVQVEKESAEKNFPMFHSYHEASAVLLEEIEELGDAFEQIAKEYKELWSDIKNNYAIDPDDYKYIKLLGVCAAIEAIQVAAVAQKTIDSGLWE